MTYICEQFARGYWLGDFRESPLLRRLSLSPRLQLYSVCYPCDPIARNRNVDWIDVGLREPYQMLHVCLPTSYPFQARHLGAT